MEYYVPNLRIAASNHPEDYPWYPQVSIEAIAAKMRAAFAAGTFNKDGLAVKMTCRAVGIPYTYAAIRQYLNPN